MYFYRRRHKPGHVENSFRHHKSHAEEQITGWDEGKDQEQHAYQHLLPFHPLHKERETEKKWETRMERTWKKTVFLQLEKQERNKSKRFLHAKPAGTILGHCYFVAKVLLWRCCVFFFFKYYHVVDMVFWVVFNCVAKVLLWSYIGIVLCTLLWGHYGILRG